MLRDRLSFPLSAAWIVLAVARQESAGVEALTRQVHKLDRVEKRRALSSARFSRPAPVQPPLGQLFLGEVLRAAGRRGAGLRGGKQSLLLFQTICVWLHGSYWQEMTWEQLAGAGCDAAMLDALLLSMVGEQQTVAAVEGLLREAPMDREAASRVLANFSAPAFTLAYPAATKKWVPMGMPVARPGSFFAQLEGLPAMDGVSWELLREVCSGPSFRHSPYVPPGDWELLSLAQGFVGGQRPGAGALRVSDALLAVAQARELLREHPVGATLLGELVRSGICWAEALELAAAAGVGVE